MIDLAKPFELLPDALAAPPAVGGAVMCKHDAACGPSGQVMPMQRPPP